jgi:TonB family protein
MYQTIPILMIMFVFTQAALAQSEQPQVKRVVLQSSASRLDLLAQTDQSFRINRSPLPSNSPPQPIATGSALDRGKYFSRHGLYKEAMVFFSKAADADPKNPEPYNFRARAEWQLEKHADALQDANYAIQLNSYYAEALCTRAAILNSTEHYQDAIVDAALATELKPNLKDAYTLEAAAYRNLRQYREADQTMQKLNSVADPISAFDEYAPIVDYTLYMSDVQSTIRQNWRAPQGSHAPIVVLFKLHRNGQITDVRVNNVGDATADSAAVRATKSFAPFQQPPAGSPPDFDVFIVLDSTPAKSASQAVPTPVQALPSSGVNWTGTVNQGLNIMQRYIPRSF